MTSVSLFLTLPCFPCQVYLLVIKSISWLVLELWQFSFTKDWPEIRKSEMSSSEFCPISGDWGELGISNLAQMFTIKSYWMLQNTRVITCTIFELLREKQQGGTPHPTHRLGLRIERNFTTPPPIPPPTPLPIPPTIRIRLRRVHFYSLTRATRTSIFLLLHHMSKYKKV